MLAKPGLTPQKPLQRAYQRDPEAIEAWRLERYPAIARQAKASGGEVYFWDESGFRADSVHGRTWGKQGQTVLSALAPDWLDEFAEVITRSGGCEEGDRCLPHVLPAPRCSRNILTHPGPAAEEVAQLVVASAIACG